MRIKLPTIVIETEEYKSTIKHHRQIIDENGYFCGCGDFQMVRYSDTKRPCKHLQNVARLAKEYMFEQTINHWIS